MLSLSNNQLPSLPAEIGNLVNLQDLYLESNQLSTFSAELDNLINLISLDLSGNPDLTCWETQDALDWALALTNYSGPTMVYSLKS
jgi:hypothetical protein